MKTLLVFPPHFAHQQPYLSLPALTGALKCAGVNVVQQDLNIEFFHQLTSLQSLVETMSTLEEQIRKIENQGISPELEEVYRYKRRGLLLSEIVQDKIAAAKAFFNLEDNFLDFERYQVSERVIAAVFEALSAVYYPTRISLVDLVLPYSPESSEQILSGATDVTTNPYLRVSDRWGGRLAAEEAPDLIGISVTSLTQVIPAFTLAGSIRRHIPEAKIVLGGVIVNHLFMDLASCSNLGDLWDFAIRYEGETALVRLCDALDTGSSLAKVPNLMFRDGDSVIISEAVQLEDVSALPTPCYDDLNLDLYLAPQPVLSLEPARGCYWRKCTFCNQYTVHRKSFRVRPPELVASDMDILQQQHGANIFNVVNEGMPAKQLYYLASEINKLGLDVSWYAGARLEPYLDQARLTALAASGCKKLFFGLESGSQRLLDLMDKGIYVKDLKEILSHCESAGVDPHLYLMIGYPSETDDERDLTMTVVKEALACLTKSWVTGYFSVFQPMIDSPYVRQADELGLSLKRKGKGFDLEYLFEVGEHQLSELILRRQALDQEAERMSAQLQNHFPVRGFPEEVTHYMIYKLGLPAEIEAIDPELSGDDRTNGVSRLSPTSRVRLGTFVGIGNSGLLDQPDEGVQIAYDMMADQGLRIDRKCAQIARGLRTSMSVQEIANKFRLSLDDAENAIKKLAGLGMIEVDVLTTRAKTNPKSTVGL